MPGHMTAALAPHPELQLRDALGRPRPAVLDVTQSRRPAFARELIERVPAALPRARTGTWAPTR